ncbi:MAG: hypothetical protein JST49_14170 [Bacteroidetes bacterium]|nr:hypothetical protein [Bacteroidota bacterium]
MWEELIVYRQLDKKDINPTFKKFGKLLNTLVEDYSIEQTYSVLKLYRYVNELEQAIFIEKRAGTYDLTVRTTIKPLNFYRHHKFTMVNIVPLGNIMNNYRRSFYPLTQEWSDLADFLARKIKGEIEHYFEQYNSYDKIIKRRKDIEPKDFAYESKYDLLIYAAAKTKEKSLLINYIDKWLNEPIRRVNQVEYLNPSSNPADTAIILKRIKALAQVGNFTAIETELANINL